MTTYLDYAGRTVDVLAFGGQRERGDAPLAMGLDDGQGGEVCAGAQMVAQAWLLEFLKEAGSVPYAPSEGCSFMSALRGGRMLSETDVFQQFNLAASKVRANLSALEAPGTPADEAFAEARLDAVTIAPPSVRLAVTVRTKAGASRKLILPLPLTA